MLESQLMQLREEIKKYIRTDKDSIIVFKSRNKRWMEKVFLGRIEDDVTDNFL